MISKKPFTGLAGAALLSLAASAPAAVTLNILSDSGSLRVTTYMPTQQTSVSSVNKPYGTPPTPAVTPVTSGWKIEFVPAAGFFASADNASGGMTSIMSGKLDLLFTSDTAFEMTVNVFEDGIWSTTGNGRVSAAGAIPSGIVVTEQDDLLSPEQHAHPFQTNDAVYSADGTWHLYSQLTGFTQDYHSYKITIDNDLLAESLFNLNMASGSASIAKKDFSIVITTDGSNGGGPQVPEPASLGVLGLGAAALLYRRRRSWAALPVPIPVARGKSGCFLDIAR